MTKKFRPLLDQPASQGPFWPKLWMSLATVFVDTFWKEKNWVGFRPFPMTHWKEFLISWKIRCFEIFWLSGKSTLTLSTSYSKLHHERWSVGWKKKFAVCRRSKVEDRRKNFGESNRQTLDRLVLLFDYLFRTIPVLGKMLFHWFVMFYTLDYSNLVYYKPSTMLNIMNFCTI